MSETNHILLSTKELTVGFAKGVHRTVLFENLNLTLFSGELVCFMGPNGVGKTSLIRTLTGLQKHLSGEVRSAGTPSIALVLTDKITASHMTVYDLITYGRYPYLNWNISLTEKDRAIIQQSIDQLHLNELVHKQLFELSDGQLQMVMIAKALAQDTTVIILDEPTAHLDLNNRVEIMNILRNLSRTTRKGILLATHELDLALQTADKIWLATNHKTIVEGIPEDLVLNGTFDHVFQLKGFDLKTGKIHHQAHRQFKVNLSGDGHEYLWTKNSLERNGYEINSNSYVRVELKRNEESCLWLLDAEGQSHAFYSLEKLLKHLNLLQVKN